MARNSIALILLLFGLTAHAQKEKSTWLHYHWPYSFAGEAKVGVEWNRVKRMQELCLTLAPSFQGKIDSRYRSIGLEYSYGFSLSQVELSETIKGLGHFAVYYQLYASAEYLYGSAIVQHGNDYLRRYGNMGSFEISPFYFQMQWTALRRIKNTFGFGVVYRHKILHEFVDMPYRGFPSAFYEKTNSNGPGVKIDFTLAIALRTKS